MVQHKAGWNRKLRVMNILIKGHFQVSDECPSDTIDKVFKRLNDELKKTGLKGEINELGNPANRYEYQTAKI